MSAITDRYAARCDETPGPTAATVFRAGQDAAHAWIALGSPTAGETFGAMATVLYGLAVEDHGWAWDNGMLAHFLEAYLEVVFDDLARSAPDLGRCDSEPDAVTAAAIADADEDGRSAEDFWGADLAGDDPYAAYDADREESGPELQGDDDE
jgi:hypothetical protein